MTAEQELIEAAKRVLSDRSLEHPIIAVGIAVAYADGRTAEVVLAPRHLEALLAAVARLEHRVQLELDAVELRKDT